MTRHLSRMAAWVLAAALPLATQAACLSDEQVDELVRHYLARTPAPTPLGLSDTDGACTRAKLHVRLEKALGKPVIGYKAGLTNPAVQQRFQTDQPVWGRLYDGMIQPNGSAFEAAFGARPLYEADMLVRVSGTAINQARTPADVLAAIDQVIPFVELPDLAVQEPPKLNGAAVSAINVGARLGVAGEPIAVPADAGQRQALLDALRDMQVRVTDAQGQVLGQGKGSDILEHPLNAVVWLVEALRREGLNLQPGQLVSLGSFSPLLPPRPGLQVTVHYDGLPGAQPVRVTFR